MELICVSMPHLRHIKTSWRGKKLAGCARLKRWHTCACTWPPMRWVLYSISKRVAWSRYSNNLSQITLEIHKFCFISMCRGRSLHSPLSGTIIQNDLFIYFSVYHSLPMWLGLSTSSMEDGGCERTALNSSGCHPRNHKFTRSGLIMIVLSY